MQFDFFLVFFRKDIKLVLKIFWPHRSKANGFSIKNLAREYRLKISSVNCSEVSSQQPDNKNSKNIKNNTDNIPIVNLSAKKKHWANRDFSEYKEAA